MTTEEITEEASKQNLLKASVVIPTCKRPDFLERCLLQLLPQNQTAEKNSYEVIVADDDPLGSATDVIKNKFPWVRLTKAPQRGAAGARNAGARLAKAPLIIFTDDDCIPSADFVKGYVEAFYAPQNNAKVFIGPTTCKDSCKNPFDTAPINAKGEYDFSCNFACERKLFEDLGGFDEIFKTYFEDYDFFKRARLRGAAPVFAPVAAVDHPPRKLANVFKRVSYLRNHFFYLIKHGNKPIFFSVMRDLLAQWRNRLIIKTDIITWLRAFGSFFCEFFLTLIMWNSSMKEARVMLEKSRMIQLAPILNQKQSDNLEETKEKTL